MKKLLTILAIFFSFSSFGQGTVNITLQVQTRDIEYIASIGIIKGDNVENLWDSLKVKFRVANPPTGNTTVSITATTDEWFYIFLPLKTDYISITQNCTSRLEALLRAVNQSYLTAKLDLLDTQIQDSYQTARVVGRFKLRKQ